MIRQASDLMSKYVGETEQNMAAHVRRPSRKAAVLLLDEADSFLRRPPRRERSYEVTEVNEMLQGMERFKPASSSAPPTCWTASTRRRCGASPSRCVGFQLLGPNAADALQVVQRCGARLAIAASVAS
jgi:SpoVK/Ycf46/Vps4 family AAA+-type ATPase